MGYAAAPPGTAGLTVLWAVRGCTTSRLWPPETEEVVGLGCEWVPRPGRRKSPTALPGTQAQAGESLPQARGPSLGRPSQWVGGGGPAAPHFRDRECRAQSRATGRGGRSSQTPAIPGALHVFPHHHQSDSGTERARAPGEWQQGPGLGTSTEQGGPGRVRPGPGVQLSLPAALPLTAAVTIAMSDYENEDQCWGALESFRVKLISIIDPSRITPYLRQCKVLSPDDEEQVLSDPNLVIRKRKVGQCCLSGSAGHSSGHPQHPHLVLPVGSGGASGHSRGPRAGGPDGHGPARPCGFQVCSWTSCSGPATRAT